ncbi:MAG: 50S ribosomal protein L25 [Solirubrobacteraceae bacterium]|nr:50S ribosomal protein L25 [Solirubrobacteraceae bacterium]
MANETLTLALQSREAGNSRDARRLRRAGTIPGVLYGLDKDPLSVQVQPSDLRLVLIDNSALFNVELEGETVPVLIKQADRHPVRGNVTHVDFLRVDLDQPIEAVVPIELTGVEESQGVIDRGVLDHQLREVTISALPTSIPDVITIDVAWMGLGDTFLLNRISPPEGVSIVSDHAAEIAVVTIVASRGSVSTANAAEGEESGDDAGSDES